MAQINKPSDYFNTLLYTGNSTARSITGVGFAPDFVWLKDRTRVEENCLWDTVRGATKNLISNRTNVESTEANGLTAFGSDGFSLGSEALTNYNNDEYASWNWKAGGSASSNSNGTITSSVSANTDAGFSIVSYTGNGGSTPKTVGHGLGVAPKMIIIKPTNLTYDWMTYNENVGATKGMCLNTTQAPFTSSNFNDTAPTTSVFSVKNNATNETNGNYIAYCFAEKQGYSKFGSYTGNGNADGTFVYTGFKPAFVMIKKTSGTSNWTIWDSVRQSNEINKPLWGDLNSAEAAQSTVKLDLLSNGFKIRGNGSNVGSSGGSYIYMAFASNPLVTSTGVPATAR